MNRSTPNPRYSLDQEHHSAIEEYNRHTRYIGGRTWPRTRAYYLLLFESPYDTH